jgi:hypothetical protein
MTIPPAHHIQALNRTHSDLVKFSSYDADYERVLSLLKDTAAAAVRTIPRRNFVARPSGPSPRPTTSFANSLTLSTSQAGTSVITGEGLGSQVLGTNALCT